MIKLLQIIKEEKMCVGDRNHNENINLLFKDVDKHSKYAKEIIQTLEIALKDVSDNWIIHKLSMDACRKLSSAMKAKTEKTYIKRINNYLYKVLLSSRYNMILEKPMIEAFNNLCNKYGVK